MASADRRRRSVTGCASGAASDGEAQAASMEIAASGAIADLISMASCLNFPGPTQAATLARASRTE